MCPPAHRIRRWERCCSFIKRQQIIVRHGKGGKDRIVMLPKSNREELQRHLEWRRQLHERDLAKGLARVALPDALARKYPRAAQVVARGGLVLK